MRSRPSRVSSPARPKDPTGARSRKLLRNCASACIKRDARRAPPGRASAKNAASLAGAYEGSMTLQVAIQMDPIESINIDADSSFVLALEAQKRGHALYHYLPR